MARERIHGPVDGARRPGAEVGDPGSGGFPGSHRSEVVDVLLARGERMYQGALTVSRYDASLADTGNVVKVSVGRENLVCLPAARPRDGSALEAGSGAAWPSAGDRVRRTVSNIT